MPAEIDVTNAARIGGELSLAIADGAGIVVADMTDTTFCNSSGISVLALAHRQAAANGAELRLVVPSAAVLRALKLVRMDCLLPIYPSLDAALSPEALSPEAAPEPDLAEPVLAAAGAGRGPSTPR
jgi:anti-anti-sigma factor